MNRDYLSDAVSANHGRVLTARHDPPSGRFGPRTAHLDRHPRAGFVPHVVPVTGETITTFDGDRHTVEEVDFSNQHPDRQRDCMDRFVCSTCGQRIIGKGWIPWTHPDDEPGFDPANHLECLAAAVRICPSLRRGTHRHYAETSRSDYTVEDFDDGDAALRADGAYLKARFAKPAPGAAVPLTHAEFVDMTDQLDWR